MDPDLPLIEALRAGDDSALNELINRYREPLFQFVFRYLRNETAARDVVQETFVRAYFKAAKFESRSSVKTWLHAIALNLSREQARRLGKHRGEIALDTSSARRNELTEIADGGPGPNDTTVQRDRAAILQRAIDRLPSSLRDALILFSLEGKSQKEAAEILHTTPKTVELRVYHAKKKLREWLGDLLAGNAHASPDKQ